MVSEKDIHTFIAQYPWLLNVNYQNIPELKDVSEIEVHVAGGKRIDLVLKDVITGFPVIVEFKRGDLNRDDIGQILEYRARILNYLNNEDSLLFKIFGNKLSAPKMVLVVKRSDEYGIIACNLQNIELYQYGNIEEKIISGDVPFRKTVEDFSNTLKHAAPTINRERSNFLETNVLSVLKELFKEKNIENKWPYYNNYNLGEFWPFRKCFLNNWFFSDQEISLGLYEDILFYNDLAVCFSYFLPNSEIAEKLETKIKTEKEEDKFTTDKYPDDESTKYFLDIRYEPNYFYSNKDVIKNILSYNLNNYLEICGWYNDK